MYKNLIFLLLISFAGFAQTDLGIIDKNTTKKPRAGLIRLSSDSLKLYFQGITGSAKEVVSTNNTYSNPSWISSLSWSKIISTPTTIAGYGITDYNNLFDTRLGTKTTSNITEGSNLYWTNARGDARYPQLTGSYANPTWVTSLDNSKITGLGSIALLNTINLTSNVTGLLPDGNISSASAWNAKQNALNGTGFVKSTAGTISYDNNTYITTSSASSTYAPLASPTFTGTVSGVTKSMVGLFNVDNTSDVNKPVSTAQQTAIDLRVPIISSISELQSFSGLIAQFDGSIWNKKSGNITSNGGSYAGTLIRVSSSVYWERRLDYITPEMFGAVGDSLTDDTQAINSTLDAAYSSKRDIRFLGQKVYRITSKISKPVDGFRVIGENRKSSIIGNFGYALIELTAAKNGGFEGISFKNYYSNATEDNGYSLIYAYYINVQNFSIRNCYFTNQNANTSAITFYVNTDNTTSYVIDNLRIENNKFENIGRIATTLMNRNSTYLLAKNVYFNNNIGNNLGTQGSYGFLLSLDGYGQDFEVNSNSVTNALGIGIENTGWQDGTFIGNKFFGTSKTYNPFGFSGINSNMDNNVVSNNITDVLTNNSYFFNMSNSKFSNNVFQSSSGDIVLRNINYTTFQNESYTGYRYGFYLESSGGSNSKNNTITNCVFSNNASGFSTMRFSGVNTQNNIFNSNKFNRLGGLFVDEISSASNNIGFRNINNTTVADYTLSYAPSTTGTAILKGNGSGGFSSATAGTDYLGTSSSLAAANITGTIPVSVGGTGTTTAFTTGSVVFAGASGAYSQSNSKFFWDNTNFRLGLNNTSPNYLLDAQGDVNFIGTARFGLSTAKVYIRSNGLTFNRNIATGAIDDATGYGWQLQHTKSTTASSDNVSWQLYNTAGTVQSTSILTLWANKVVSINASSPQSSAKFQVDGTDGGVLIPRMTTTQRNAVASPIAGLLVYDTDLLRVMSFDGTVWGTVGSLTGSFSATATAQTAFTVTLPTTMPNSTYKVEVTPTSAIVGSGACYISSKTTTTFILTCNSLTGTASFDWAVLR